MRLISPRFVSTIAMVLLLRASGSPVAEAQEFQCVIDQVDGVLTNGGNVSVVGWAARNSEDAPVRKVEVYLDGSIPIESTLGGWRPDVMNHFGRPDYAWAGWNASASLRTLSPGRHRITAVAISHGGLRSPCGERSFLVRNVPASPSRPPWIIGAEILLRAAVLLLWLTLVGLPIARLFPVGPASLAAPLMGLALFAVLSEAGARMRIAPARSAYLLAALSAVVLLLSARLRRLRLRRRPRRPALGTFACAALFALVAVVPFAVHGEGAVLGDIDDGIRECATADAIVRHGWQIGLDQWAYLSTVRYEMEERARGRRGPTHLLAAAAQAFGVRAHAVYAPVVLVAGCLVVLGTGLLASRVLARLPRYRWIPPALVAVNSLLFTNLYTQHLGSLLAAALFLLFLVSALTLVWSHRRGAFLPVALCLAAGWSLYPEALPVWLVVGLLSLFLSIDARLQRRALLRYFAAVVVAAAINPTGLAIIGSWTRPGKEARLATSFSRTVTGDTHYFPSIGVLAGIVPYRLDAPAPVGRPREALIPLVGVMIVVMSFLGWRALRSVDARLAVVLLAPLALALYVNERLSFPYGFAKILVLSVAVWSVVFVLLLSHVRIARRRGAMALTLTPIVLLCLFSVRHVVMHSVRLAPSYDPEFRSLTALSAAVAREAVFRLEDYPKATRYWAAYFLGDNPVDLESDRSAWPPLSPYYQLVDLRRSNGSSGIARAPSTRSFAVMPVAEDPAAP